MFDESIVKPPYSQCTVAEYYLLYSLVRLYKPKTIVEIGTFHGSSSYVMASALIDVGDSESRIATMDIEINYVNKARENLTKWSVIDKVRLIHGTSDVIKEFNYNIDFAFIDGGHTYEFCTSDLVALDGTPVMVLHDANAPLVKRAIIDFIKSSKSLYHNIFFDSYPKDPLIHDTPGVCVLLKYGDKL